MDTFISVNPFAIIFGGLIFTMIVEYILPNRQLKHKKGWVTRAIIFNIIQLGVVILGAITWEKWLEGPSLFKLPWSPFYNGLFAYIVNTWIFYWWHLLRHENNFCWLVFHQFHHSPEDLEVLTSFYKHPIEILTNSLIITVLTGPILGLDSQTNAWLTIFSAFSEFYYHMNVKTPWWTGFLMQRPESHLVHHSRDKQFVKNHADLPIWDILGGTFFNPTNEYIDTLETGFSKDREQNWVKILSFQNVLSERPKKLPKNLIHAAIITLLLLLGSLQMLGLIFRSNQVKGLAFVTTAAPLPFVFTSFAGVETFSTTFELDILLKNGTNTLVNMDHKLYAKLQGPYNRKNVIGAVFSHGPFFVDKNMIKIRDQVLDWAICKGHVIREFINQDIQVQTAKIIVRSKTKGNEGKIWFLDVNC